MNVSEVLKKLRPGAQWAITGFDYEGLQWLEPPVYEGGQTKPTKEEWDAAVEEYNRENSNTEYKKLREFEYPPFLDYLDGVVKGDQAQIDAYINKCLAVKAKYPKPE